MPEEPLEPVPAPPPHRRLPDAKRQALLEKFRDIERFDDLFKPLADALPVPRTPRRGSTEFPPKMYHPGGRFLDRSGARFDYVFPELLENPTLPQWAFVRVPVLIRGTGDVFHSRRVAREKERLSIGLKYGHGDLPPRVAASPH